MRFWPAVFGDWQKDSHRIAEIVLKDRDTWDIRLTPAAHMIRVLAEIRSETGIDL